MGGGLGGGVGWILGSVGWLGGWVECRVAGWLVCWVVVLGVGLIAFVFWVVVLGVRLVLRLGGRWGVFGVWMGVGLSVGWWGVGLFFCSFDFSGKPFLF